MDIVKILVILIFFFVLYALVKGGLLKKIILSHWHHRFEKPPFSSQEFYQGIKELLDTKLIKHVGSSRVNYSQGGLLSPNREYLRIQYKEFVFDLCAAPFGTGYFVSWWLGEMGNPIRDLLINIPLIGRLFKKREKTFFELDTAIMFKETVSVCIRETIERLTIDKGLRKLADAEWKDYGRLH